MKSEALSQLVELITLESVSKEIKDIKHICKKSVNYDALFIEAVYNKFDTETILTMKYLWNLYDKVFKNSKLNEYSEAQYDVKKADAYFSDAKLSNEVLGYLNVYIRPKKAYFYYKQNDFERAKEYTKSTIENLEVIEGDFPNMHMGKVQQLHNLCRIEFKQGNFINCFKSLGSILEYLLFRISPCPNDASWGDHCLKNCNQDLINLMTRQVFNEAVVFLIRIETIKNDEKEMFKACFLKLKDLPISTASEYSSDYILWIDCMVHFYENDYKKFYKLSRDFLSNINDSFAVLNNFIFIKVSNLISVNVKQEFI